MELGEGIEDGEACGGGGGGGGGGGKRGGGGGMRGGEQLRIQDKEEKLTCFQDMTVVG